MEEEDISIIFSNVDAILVLNSQLLEELKKKEENWDNTSLIGDVFLKLVFFIYLKNFLINV